MDKSDHAERLSAMSNQIGDIGTLVSRCAADRVADDLFAEVSLHTAAGLLLKLSDELHEMGDDAQAAKGVSNGS